MLPFIEKSEQAHGLNDQPGLFVCFFRGNLERRIANLGPPARATSTFRCRPSL